VIGPDLRSSIKVGRRADEWIRKRKMWERKIRSGKVSDRKSGKTESEPEGSYFSLPHFSLLRFLYAFHRNI
jgi:hypothetical protein